MCVTLPVRALPVRGIMSTGVAVAQSGFLHKRMFSCPSSCFAYLHGLCELISLLVERQGELLPDLGRLGVRQLLRALPQQRRGLPQQLQLLGQLPHELLRLQAPAAALTRSHQQEVLAELLLLPFSWDDLSIISIQSFLMMAIMEDLNGMSRPQRPALA